jgi:hypothetical protein
MTDIEEEPEPFSGSIMTVYSGKGSVARVSSWDFVLNNAEQEEQEKQVRRTHGKSCRIMWQIHD